MSEKINHNEQHDALAELFRRQLEDHQSSVDSDGWSEIKRRLHGKRKTKMIWLWYTGAMAAAASIALLVIINQPFSEDTALTVISQVTNEKGIMQDNLQEEANHHRASYAISQNTGVSSQQNAVVSIHRITPLVDSGKFVTPVRSTKIDSSDVNYTEYMVFSKVGQIDQSVVSTEIGQPENEQQVVTQAKNDVPKLDISLVEDKPEEDPAAKKTNKWLLAVAFGTGGYTDGFNSGDESGPMMADSPGFNGNNTYAADLSSSINSFKNMNKSDFSNINHRPPLSVSITARKGLGRFWGVESGVAYTYLSSQFEWSDYDAHQKLHYLGIPLNVVVYLWNSNPDWRVYLSGGVMVEKGLRAIYTQEKRLANGSYITTVKSSIDKLQWSLNGALGINYRFNKGLGIYFEPRVGYCFDNEQPISMRTEWPVFLGINLGLNYEF